MVRMGLITKIIIPIAVVAGVWLSLTYIPVLGFQYLFWRMHQILDNVPENELIDRTKDLPEVKLFLEKYGETKPYISTDFHIGIVYDRPPAQLDVRIDLDTGFPQHSWFWCEGEEGRRFTLSDEALIQSIKDC